ncbi:hypothetical protein B0H17DRAFT_1150208 [Mycena rosella]|uniref:Uncharacterized protein n=1 Tax=Mycena rosella TaxID=1033263 RepID=A0AAD7BVD2_MYCRO|nr:hypothetical protein B0H17DRAFT_1150208 [Mycena rosella]
MEYEQEVNLEDRQYPTKFLAIVHIFKPVAIASTLILGVLAVPVPTIDLPACTHVAEFSVQPGLINLNDPPPAPKSTIDMGKTKLGMQIASSLLPVLKISAMSEHTLFSSEQRPPPQVSLKFECFKCRDRSGFMVFREMRVKNEALQKLCCETWLEFRSTEKNGIEARAAYPERYAPEHFPAEKSQPTRSAATANPQLLRKLHTRPTVLITASINRDTTKARALRGKVWIDSFVWKAGTLGTEIDEIPGQGVDAEASPFIRDYTGIQ